MGRGNRILDVREMEQASGRYRRVVCIHIKEVIDLETMERVREIYERQVDRVYRTAMTLMKNKDDAEDIVQSVFLTLIEKDIEFDSQEHEKAWFIVTTRNRCKDVLKSYWRKSVDLKDEEVDQTQAADGRAGSEIPAVYANAEVEETRRLLMSLPENQREIILLHYYEGYTVNEVAEMLGTKESTIRSAIGSAKRALKRAADR